MFNSNAWSKKQIWYFSIVSTVVLVALSFVVGYFIQQLMPQAYQTNYLSVQP